jgi:hypothetical protein
MAYNSSPNHKEYYRYSSTEHSDIDFLFNNQGSTVQNTSTGAITIFSDTDISSSTTGWFHFDIVKTHTPFSSTTECGANSLNRTYQDVGSYEFVLDVKVADEDLTNYANWYCSRVWDSSGNPIENQSAPTVDKESCLAKYNLPSITDNNQPSTDLTQIYSDNTSSQTQYYSEGWNLISIPGDKKVALEFFAQKCSDESVRVFKYKKSKEWLTNQSNSSDTDMQYLQSNEGFWVYFSKECSVNFSQ